jgi:hypothetical protein
MNTIGEAISRVRNNIKAVDTDSFITDRLIYSNIIKYAKLYIKQQTAQTVQSRFNSLYVKLPCVDLIEVDKVEACCDVKSGVLIKRTKDKLPGIMEGAGGLLLRTVASVDGSEEVFRTTPQFYNAQQKTSAARYNKTKYYWYLNGYLYIPNVDWDSIAVEGIFENKLMPTCDDPCKAVQDEYLNIPSDLFAQIEQQVINDFLRMSQINPDNQQGDNQSQLRS